MRQRVGRQVRELDRQRRLVLPTDMTQHPACLSVMTTPLIGRATDLERVRARLGSGTTRLLTLIGPGGVGKTCLALAAAQAATNVFDGRVWCVDLAPMSDPALLIPTVSRTLNQADIGRGSALDRLAGVVGDAPALLVLDNFESVPAAAPGVAELLRACPTLVVLATSRQALRLCLEQVIVVQPLAVPERTHFVDPAALVDCPSVALFVARAQAASGTFSLTPSNAPTVAELCRRLDGLPLAIELAAARTPSLGVGTILSRFGDALDLLKGDCSDRPPRHRTLRATIAWSHERLSVEERTLFHRLSVFAGGWTLEAAEAVCGSAEPLSDASDAFQTVDLLEQLAARSLVQVEDRGPTVRYRFLAAVREYAAEHLRLSGEQQAIWGRHRDWCLALGRHGSWQAEDYGSWLARIESEHDNLCAALERANQAGEVAQALDLGGMLGDYWQVRGDLRAGRTRLVEVLRRSDSSAPSHLRAHALVSAGFLAFLIGEATPALTELEAALRLYRANADREGIGWAAAKLGLVLLNADQPARARPLFEEAILCGRTESNRVIVAWAQFGLAYVALARKDLVEAERRFEAALAECQEAHYAWGSAAVQHHRCQIALLRGDLASAADLAQTSLAAWWQLRDERAVSDGLEAVALVATQLGQAARAARLFAAAEAARVVLGAGLLGHLAEYRAPALQRVSEALGPAGFEATVGAGQAMTLSEAVADGLEALAVRTVRHPFGPGGALSSRECEVLRLLARGFTNRRIADELIIGVRTAETHVERILRKLGLANRAAAVHWALGNGVTAPDRQTDAA